MKTNSTVYKKSKKIYKQRLVAKIPREEASICLPFKINKEVQEISFIL
jgi:thymidylate synthase ThyX